VSIIPDPNISNFKPYIFKVYGKPMRHIGEAKHRDVRTGLQHPIGFFPNSHRRQDIVPLETLHLLTIWRVNHAAINRVIRNFCQCFTRISRHQTHITHFGILS
jgi:hypothetical protein